MEALAVLTALLIGALMSWLFIRKIRKNDRKFYQDMIKDAKEFEKDLFMVKLTGSTKRKKDE